MMRGMRTLTVIIPCFNEASTIAEVVQKVRGAKLPQDWKKEIIVVDDGSGEETIAALRTIEASVRVIYREKNCGKGAVVKEGLRASAGEYCIIQDADLELDPAQYRELLHPIITGRAEVVFGYRVFAQGGSALLFYGGKLLSLVFNAVFFTGFRDIPCCYKVFSREHIPALLSMPSDDFVFDAIEMTYVLSRTRTIAQVPVRYFPRTRKGGKKLHMSDGLRCAAAIVLLRLGFYNLAVARELPKVARFLIAGIAAAFVHLATLYVFVEWWGAWYLSSSAIGFLAGYVVSFVLQKFWTFEDRRLWSIFYQLPLHFTLAMFNLSVNTGLMFAFVDYLNLWYLVAQILSTLVIVIASFMVSRKLFSPNKA